MCILTIFENHRESSIKPKVTIGMCVKDCESTAREAIDSILNQNYPHEFLEIVVVDDGSEDRTFKIIHDSVQNTDIHVKLFHCEWAGIGHSTNVVVDNAQGEYILWVDGDMILPKDHVKRQVECIEQNPNVGIAKAKHKVIPEKNLVAFLEHVPFMVYDAMPEFLCSKLPGTGGAIYRVSAIRKVNGFNNLLKHSAEDQDAAYRLKKAGWLIVQSSTFFYEIRPQTWKKLLNKYVWYGYGCHYLYNGNREIFSIFRMNPLASFIAGVLYAFDAYNKKLTKRKSLLLLPFHFTLKMSAWCLGFTKSHIEFLNSKQVKKY